MGSTLVTGGDYVVELDTGEIEDGFQLNDPVRGILAGYTTTTTRTNLLPDPSCANASIGTYWQAIKITESISSDYAYAGTTSLKGVIDDGTAGQYFQVLQTSTSMIDVVAGQTYTISAYIYLPTSNTANTSWRANLFFWNGTSYTGSNAGSTVVVTRGSWTRLTTTATVPSGYYKALPRIQAISTLAVGQVAYVDAWLLETGSTLLPYFDGTYADTYTNYTLTRQDWNATQNASTSTATWGLTSTYVEGYPLTGTTTFTDVSSLVSSASIRRGRKKIQDQAVAGSIQLALFDNANRDLDPYNQDSVFFNASAEIPGLSPNRQIRISRNGTYLFQGRVTGYRYEYGEPNTVVISGSDDFVLLAALELDAQTPAEETSAARVTRILDLASVAWGSNRDITSSPDTTLGAYAISDGTNVLAYLQKVALKAEQGRLYMRAADNYLVFEQRIGNTLSAPTVTFADVGVGLPYNRLSIDYTADDVVNRATIRRTGGTDQTAQDATSITTYYAQEYSDTDNLVSSDAQALTLAEYLLFPTPEPRFTGLEVSFASIPDEGDQDSIAFLEIGETIEITRTFTAGTPASITEELVIEGIEHLIDAVRGHTVALFTSPTDLVYTFVLGDAIYGILGVTDPQPVLT